MVYPCDHLMLVAVKKQVIGEMFSQICSLSCVSLDVGGLQYHPNSFLLILYSERVMLQNEMLLIG